jgi:hypothetical protein
VGGGPRLSLGLGLTVWGAAAVRAVLLGCPAVTSCPEAFLPAAPLSPAGCQENCREFDRLVSCTVNEPFGKASPPWPLMQGSHAAL